MRISANGKAETYGRILGRLASHASNRDNVDVGKVRVFLLDFLYQVREGRDGILLAHVYECECQLDMTACSEHL